MLKQPAKVAVRELKAKASEILRSQEDSPGKEIIITRHGKPSAKRVSVRGRAEGIPWSERKSLRNSFAGMHEFSDADFEEAKRIWEPKFDPCN